MNATILVEHIQLYTLNIQLYNKLIIVLEHFGLKQLLYI